VAIITNKPIANFVFHLYYFLTFNTGFGFLWETLKAANITSFYN